MEQTPNLAGNDTNGFMTALPINAGWSMDVSRNGLGANPDAGSTTVDERRADPRVDTSALVVLTPLAAVATRIEGSVINVSEGGVRVRLDAQLKELPRVGEVYRIQSQDDLILCEVRNSEVAGGGAELGLQIVHWGNAGKLRRLVHNKRAGLREKAI